MSTDTKQKIGENKISLSELRRNVASALDFMDISSEPPLFIQKIGGGYTKLLDVSFMPHKTYLKLYLNEIDEQFAAWEKELDELTA